MIEINQLVLNAKQIAEFYHDNFVNTQVHNFVDMIEEANFSVRKVIDVGGGCGFFADVLTAQTELDVHVVDMDPRSVATCQNRGVAAEVGDALNPVQRGDEDVVSFNLILHHLVGASDAATKALQARALSVWRNKAKAIFVNEYIYDSYFGNTSGWLISRLLSVLGLAAGKLVPSLRANTFGTGVRFRAHQEWVMFFGQLGFTVAAYRRGAEEDVSLARRMLMIKSCRRDSYLLVSK